MNKIIPTALVIGIGLANVGVISPDSAEGTATSSMGATIQLASYMPNQAAALSDGHVSDEEYADAVLAEVACLEIATGVDVEEPYIDESGFWTYTYIPEQDQVAMPTAQELRYVIAELIESDLTDKSEKAVATINEIVDQYYGPYAQDPEETLGWMFGQDPVFNALAMAQLEAVEYTCIVSFTAAIQAAFSEQERPNPTEADVLARSLGTCLWEAGVSMATPGEPPSPQVMQDLIDSGQMESDAVLGCMMEHSRLFIAPME